MDIYPLIVNVPDGVPWSRKIEEIQKRHTEELEQLRRNSDNQIRSLQAQIDRLNRKVGL